MQVPQTLSLISSIILDEKKEGRSTCYLIRCSLQDYHNTHEYVRQHIPRTALDIDIRQDYRQFEDVTHVLSEANTKTDILDRFLRLYQVLENFMVRRTVVKVINSPYGRFSVRDFRRLYKETTEREQDSLALLFDDAFRLMVPPSSMPGARQPLQTYIRQLWSSSLPQPTRHAMLESELARIVPNERFNPLLNFHTRLDAKSFARIVYMLRNSIVHNKETEFHLTHKSLGPELLHLINCGIIPSIEEMIFALIVAPTPVVRYGRQQVNLY
jgi:hypothetical protein